MLAATSRANKIMEATCTICKPIDDSYDDYYPWNIYWAIGLHWTKSTKLNWMSLINTSLICVPSERDSVRNNHKMFPSPCKYDKHTYYVAQIVSKQQFPVSHNENRQPAKESEKKLERRIEERKNICVMPGESFWESNRRNSQTRNRTNAVCTSCPIQILIKWNFCPHKIQNSEGTFTVCESHQTIYFVRT